MKVFGGILFFWSAVVFAAPASRVPLESRERQRAFDPARLHFSLGFGSNAYRYSESKMHEESSHRSLLAKVLIPASASPFRFVGEYEYFSGLGTYYGQTWSETPLTTPTANQSHVFKGTLGLRQLSGDTLMFGPFVGLGYRYLLNRDEGPGSYSREIRSAFLPVGFEWTLKPADHWSFSAILEADAFLGGSTTSNLSESSPSLPDLSNRQDFGSGSRVTLDVTYSFPDFALSARPYIQRWHIEDSQRERLDESSDLLEPENETTIIGTDFLITF